MKKHVSILLGLLVIFSSLFVSCDENELDSNICKITVKSEGNGTVSITDYIGTSVNVLIGNRVEVVATPDDGWAFIGWYVSGTESPVSTDAVFTFTTSESVTLTARFAKLSDIIIRSGGNGRVAFKGAAGNSIPVVPGTEVTVIATPDTDCDFVGWFVGDSETPISTEKVYTFTVTESIILTGQFSKRPIVTVRSAGNGSVSIKDTYYTSKAFLPGTEVTVIATPYKDCDFIGWFVADNKSPISTDLEYTFNVTENITLTAKFSKRPVVTIHSTDNGSASFKDYDGTFIAVLPDTEVTVVATPNENCDFVGWFINDEEIPLSTDAEYTFKVEENITLTAKFNKRPIITIHSAGNGSVSFKDYNGTSIAVLPGNEVTIIATPDDGYIFKDWTIDITQRAISTDAEYTFTAIENVTLTAQFEINYNGHEYVDLALPSGLKWAICNIGATRPEDYGYYYAWGETEEKSNYEWSSYKWCNGSNNTMTKYCTDSSYGIVDHKTTLDFEDDVAHVKWGGKWRMPTSEEQEELLNNCKWTWTTQNGVRGYKVTSKINGNSIFLPAAGVRNNNEIYDSGKYGYYWSSSIYYDSSYSYIIYFYSEYHYIRHGNRYNGRSVRPVCE